MQLPDGRGGIGLGSYNAGAPYSCSVFSVAVRDVVAVVVVVRSAVMSWTHDDAALFEISRAFEILAFILQLHCWALIAKPLRSF